MIVAIDNAGRARNDAFSDRAGRGVFHLMVTMKEAAQKISRVPAKPGVKGAPSSRERQARYVLLDRHAAKARLKRRASLDAPWRLAMTERPCPLKHPTEPCLAVTM